MSEDFKNLLTEYKPMVVGLAKKFPARFFEDLVQEGNLALYTATKSYNTNKNTTFKTYCRYIVLGYMQHWLRDKSRIIKPNSRDSITQEHLFVQLDSHISDDGMQLHEIIKDNSHDDIDNVIQIKLILDFMNDSNRNKQIFIDYFFSGKSQNAISIKHNISQMQVSRVLNRLKKQVIDNFKEKKIEKTNY